MRRTLQKALLVGVIAVLSLVRAQARPAATDPNVTISPANRLRVFDKAWETINKKYFDPKFNGVNWPQMKFRYRPMAEAAADKIQLLDVLRRMLSELRTSHTSVRGGFQHGTGISYVQIEGKWVVRTVAPGSPGHVAGVERGWIVTSSQGECITAGKKVAVELTDLLEQKRAFEMTCGFHGGNPDGQSSVRTLENGVVYLRLPNFLSDSGKWFLEQMATHNSSRAIVLDLRGNWGGDAEVLLKCLTPFYATPETIGTFRSRKGKEKVAKVEGSKLPYRGRIVVLIDQISGSSSEIFSRALQEAGRATIVGRPSLGGVLGATHYKLPSGFDIHVPIWDYTSAKGVRLEGRGVTPDVLVPVTIKSFREGKDTDLDRALELIEPVRSGR